MITKTALLGGLLNYIIRIQETGESVKGKILNP